MKRSPNVPEHWQHMKRALFPGRICTPGAKTTRYKIEYPKLQLGIIDFNYSYNIIQRVRKTQCLFPELKWIHITLLSFFSCLCFLTPQDILGA